MRGQETRTGGRWHIVVDLTRKLEGEEVLDGVKDGGGGDDELPVGEEAVGLWEVYSTVKQ